MFAKFLNLWYSARNNLWFTPAMYCLAYFLATIGLFILESNVLLDLKLPPIFFSGSVDDAKSLTSTLLSAMITMATLAISITVVALSLAASQMGPRLIKTFMSDNKTKSYIGLFFGTVISCFMLAMILHDAGAEVDPPSVTITIVFVICFINLFVLLGFVSHVAHSSIADNIVLSVSKQLLNSINRLSKRENLRDNLEDKKNRTWPKDFDKKNTPVYFEKSGYVQLIEYNALKRIAAKEGLRIEITFKAGHFMIKGEEGVYIYPKHKANTDVIDDVRDAFVLGNSRTPTQDVEYSIRHLVEIAIRALSPGINDSFTAINVIDQLSAGMGQLFNQNYTPDEFMYDDDKPQPLLKAYQETEADVIFNAFDQIRENAKDNPAVTRHIIGKLKTLHALSNNKYQKSGIKKQTKLINEYADDIGV